MLLYINGQHFKIKMGIEGEPYITIYRHTCVMNYMMNSISKYTVKLNIPPFSMVCFYFCLISFLLPYGITRGSGIDFILSTACISMRHIF